MSNSVEPLLPVLHLTANEFEDGVLGIKTTTDLHPGDYEAVVVLRRVLPPPPPEPVGAGPFEPMEAFLERMRSEHLRDALARAEGNRTQAAKLLGVDPRTVFRLIDKNDETV